MPVSQDARALRRPDAGALLSWGRQDPCSPVYTAAEGIPGSPCGQLIALSELDLQPPDGQRQLESGTGPEPSHPLDKLLGRLCAPEADLHNPDVLHRSLVNEANLCHMA